MDEKPTVVEPPINDPVGLVQRAMATGLISLKPISPKDQAFVDRKLGLAPKNPRLQLNQEQRAQRRREQLRNSRIKWAALNPERNRELKRAYVERNREKINGSNRRRRGRRTYPHLAEFLKQKQLSRGTRDSKPPTPNRARDQRSSSFP
jgi:hypothetical protein